MLNPVSTSSASGNPTGNDHNSNGLTSPTSEPDSPAALSGGGCLPESHLSGLTSGQAQELDLNVNLNDVFAQINLTHLALMEKNQSNSTTNGAFNFQSMGSLGLSHLNSLMGGPGGYLQTSSAAPGDELANLLSGELNNNNPLAINHNLIANAGNSLPFGDSGLLASKPPPQPSSYAAVIGRRSRPSPSVLFTSSGTQSTSTFTSALNPPSASLQHLQQPANLPNLPSAGSRMLNSCSPASPGTGCAQHRHHANRPKPRSVQIKYKFGRLGQGNGQLSSPHGFCLGIDEEIIIADTFNHRICIFDKNGQYKDQFGKQGKEEGHLWYPRKVALIKASTGSNDSPRFVVCDRGSERSRMQIFSKSGLFLSRIIIKYIDIVAGLVVTPEGHIVAVDSVSARLFIIHESGELLRSFQCGKHMQEPSDIAIHQGCYYICDFKGHCVVVFNSEGEFVRKIGDCCITNYPNGIDIDNEGRVLASDSHGNKFHIVVFDQKGELLGEFECPYAKVSRCCGLKITKEGFIVTLAKNNHHVLVLDALLYNNSNQTSKQQNLPQILNSTPQQHQQQPQQIATASGQATTKEGLDLDDAMTRFNLNLLASLCETNNSANNRIGGQTPKSIASLNNNDSLTPNHNLIGQPNAGNSSMTSPFLKGSPSSSMIQSSTVNSSMLEQLQEFSFNESLLNPKSGAQSGNQTNSSFSLSKAPNERSMSDSPVTTSNELNSLGPVSTLASPTPADHSSSGSLPTPSQKAGKTIMAIRCKFGHLGSNKGQFSSPHGFCLGVDEEIVIADTYNHRICVFDKSGDNLYQFGSAGKDDGQLWHPRKVAVTKIPAGALNVQHKFVVCDRGNEKSRMQLFNRNGTFVRKINIRYIDIVAGLAITPTNNIVVVDSVMPTVFVISEPGGLLRWFDCSKHMREPSDIAINGDLYYICDFKGHCVVVFNEMGTFMRTIGNESITKFPNGIDISDYGDILVGDSHGNRFHVVVFDKNGKTLSEFECPYVKVSRCCGLKITSEGYVVTLAKNNHHVLVLNTLYIL